MHLAQSTIGMWESGKREPDFETLCKIADYFSVSIDYLVGRENTPRSGDLMLRLREIREQFKIQQKDICTALGIAQNTYSQYENNKREPNSETLCKIADFYNVTLDYLVGRTDTPTPVPQTAQSAETEIQTEFNKLTESEQKDVLDYICFKKQRRTKANATPQRSPKPQKKASAIPINGTRPNPPIKPE